MKHPRGFRPLALVVFAALVGGLVGGLAFGLERRHVKRTFGIANDRWLRQLATDGAPRLYALPEVANIRDCGGWRTADGRRVRFGRLFRSGELNNVDAGPEGFTLAESSRAFFTDTLGIRTDIDLRGDWECVGMSGSPLGTNVVWRIRPTPDWTRRTAVRPSPRSFAHCSPPAPTRPSFTAAPDATGRGRSFSCSTRSSASRSVTCDVTGNSPSAFCKMRSSSTGESRGSSRPLPPILAKRSTPAPRHSSARSASRTPTSPVSARSCSNSA